MHLSYQRYLEMGGGLDSSAFAVFSRRAERLINAQAGGQTGRRIQTEINAGRGVPCAVSECVFELAEFLSAGAPPPGARQVASESQSLGGQSESVSYVTVTGEQVQAECEEIIYNTLYGGGCGDLLYRGCGGAE